MIEHSPPPARYFAEELRLTREAGGWSQRQLADEINFSQPAIAMIETCQRTPTEEFTRAVDNVFNTAGRFERMRQRLLRPEAVPDWFKPWTDYEREAIEIHWFEPLLVPGLLQTEDYARVLFEDGSPDQVDTLLPARMERQQILEQATVIAIIDEWVLHRQVGDPKIMRQQLQHLTQAQAAVQVLPAEAETYRHLDGSFALAIVDGTLIGYVDTPARGFLQPEQEVVSRLERRWDAVRGEALPRRQSNELILKVAESWTKSS